MTKKLKNFLSWHFCKYEKSLNYFNIRFYLEAQRLFNEAERKKKKKAQEAAAQAAAEAAAQAAQAAAQQEGGKNFFTNI